MTRPRKGNNPFTSDALADARASRQEPRLVRTCGTWLDGIRCGRPVKTGQPVCDPCAYTVASDLLRSGEGRRWAAGFLGHDLVTTAAHEQRMAGEQQREAEAEQRASARAAARAEHGVVYYIRTGDNQIKIGTTSRLDERIRELRCVNLRNLLAVEPGGFDLEHQRHEQFKAWRYRPRSEDFWDALELTDHIAAVVAEHGDPKSFLRRTPA